MQMSNVAPARRKLALSGIIALNKASGCTSFDMVREVRRIFHGTRTGHAGTLDPVATGVLPILLGSATRLADYLHEQEKSYRCVVRFGVESDTYDSESEARFQVDTSALTEDALLAVLPEFTGEIMQLPPMFSAVHHEGKRLYELARSGVVVERTPRQAVIHDIQMTAFIAGPSAEAHLLVRCGKGTYMRVLAHDLGEKLQCGAILAGLERVSYGMLRIENSVTLEELKAAAEPATFVLDAGLAVEFMPRVDFGPAHVSQITRGHGAFIPGAKMGETTELCRAHDAAGHLVAIGERRGNFFQPTKVLAV